MENEVCRICLNNSVTLVDIYAKREQSDKAKPEPSLADMINECANCFIDPNDALPQQICLNCVLSAQNAFRFKQTCEKSYQQLIANRKEKQKKPAEVNSPSKAAKNGVLLAVSDIKEEHEIKVEPSPNETKFYTCPYCSKKFVHLSILRVHKKWHLENEPRKKAIGTKRMINKKSKICPTCNRNCKSATDLRKHMVTHTIARPFACTLCPQAFQLKSHLGRHMRGHTGECPYQCPFCPEAFRRSDYCRKHISKIHSGLTYNGRLSKPKIKSHHTK